MDADPPRAMAQDIDCSVLVPVLNEERHIEESVAAMRRQRFPGQLEFLFADGGSSDRTREILERLAREDPRIRVLDNPRGSVSSGLNVALAHAGGRWAVRMDAHTVYPKDYALLGVQRLARGGTRWVSGPQVPKGSGSVSRAVALALSGVIGRGGSRKWGLPRPSDPSATGHGESAGAIAEFELDTGVFAGVWERATLLEYGGWDERWPRNSDSEMAARFLAAGERLICVPAMAAEYVPRDTLKGLWRQYFGYGQFRARTYKRHPRSMRASHLLPPLVVATAAASIAAPASLRRLARHGVAFYGSALVAAGVDSLRFADPRQDAALVPLVLLVMHLAHGTGQMRGWISYGPPLAALSCLCGFGGLPTATNGTNDRVYAPSLVRSDLSSDA
jgi:GT2 family glycosyltransferase